MKKENRKISVIVPTYKGQKYIYKIIKMLEKNWITLNEFSKSDMELIFVNDYPNEKLYIKDKWKQNINVEVLEPGIKQGIHGARITGLKHSVGEYLLFLDQDDDISDNYFVSQLKNIGNKRAVLCNGIYRNGKIIYYNIEDQMSAIDKGKYFQSLSLIVSPGQVLLLKEAIPDEWCQQTLIENGSDDGLLWILMLRNKEEFSVNLDKIYVHNEDGNNTSLDFNKMFYSAKELLKYVEENRLLHLEDYLLLEKGIKFRLDRYQRYIKILSKLDIVVNKTQKYIEENNLKDIAIYGMGVIAEKYITELEKKGISISYGIDIKSESYLDKKRKIVNLNDKLEKVDLIIVTATSAYESIVEEIGKKVSYSVISMEQFL